MGFVLRDYQKEAVIAGVKFLKSEEKKYNAIEVLPTGSGKSLIIANVIINLDAPALVFQPSKEILEQNFNKLRSYGYGATIYSASFNSKVISNITYATIGSVKNSPELFRRFKYIIVDECHGVNSKHDKKTGIPKGMYNQFFKLIGDIKILGFTATPYRMSTDGFGGTMLKFLTRTRPRIFKELIYFIDNGVLFERGYLAKLKYYSIAGFDRSRLRINSTGADFTEKSVREYYKSSNFSDKILDIVKRLLSAKRKNILVFTSFVEESQYLADRIPGAAIVTAQTKKSERDRIINDFRKGIIKCVCNVGILTTGFDYPELETVVLARATMSLALYYQMIGRGIRPHPKKESTWVIDLCKNVELFGKIEDFKIEDGGNGKWFVRNKFKQLTNVYYER